MTSDASPLALPHWGFLELGWAAQQVMPITGSPTGMSVIGAPPVGLTWMNPCSTHGSRLTWPSLVLGRVVPIWSTGSPSTVLSHQMVASVEFGGSGTVTTCSCPGRDAGTGRG